MDFQPLHILVFLIAAGIGAQWVASRLRFPVILLLLLIGILVGPIGGVVQPEALFGDLLDPFVSLAVAVILFEGGMTLDIREAREVGKTLRRLILSGLVIGFALTTALAHSVVGLDIATSAVLGALLVVTGPTVILPLLRGARIASRPARLLKWEGIVNDPLGALLALFVLQVAIRGYEAGAGYAFIDQIIRFAGTSVIAGVLGAAMGYALDQALDRGWIVEHIKSPVIFAMVLVVFVLANMIGHESGLLAVTVMGMVLTNVANPHVEDVRRFKEQFSIIMVSVVFIVLSARLELADLDALIGPPLALIAMILFVVRPVVGFVATIGSGMPRRERLLIGWIAPRGVVAAAVAGAFAPQLTQAGYEDAHLLEPIVFGVIIATVVLHGLTLKPLARRLGLAHQDGNGILVVGASRWAVQLCRVLAEAGAHVVLADTRYRKVTRARLEGLDVHYGDVLAEDATMELPFERLTWILAAADEDTYNALVCLRFSFELGREHTLQLTPVRRGDGKAELSAHMTGRYLWGLKATYDEISRRFWRGGTFKSTTINENFGWAALQEKDPEALFLFFVHQARLRPIHGSSVPPSGARVIYMTEPAAPEPA